jgi:hypothetical protein
MLDGSARMDRMAPLRRGTVSSLPNMLLRELNHWRERQ